MKVKKGQIAIYIILSVFAIFMLFPYLWMFFASFKDIDQIFSMKFLPTKPTMANYKYIFTSRYSKFPSWFVNSFIIACISTGSVLFFDSLIGYVLTKFEFVGKKIVFMLIMMTLMIPTEMLVIPWYTISKTLGWVDSYWGIMFPGMISAFGIYLMRQFISTIPNELLDAARVDGMGEFVIYLKIILPLATSALGSLAIFNFIGNWNAFLWPLIVVSKTSRYTLPVGLAIFSGEAATEWNLIMAGATISTIPLIIVFLIFQKTIIQGIAMSGLKG